MLIRGFGFVGAWWGDCGGCGCGVGCIRWLVEESVEG